ncbi:right-handed parallel beta-helix repeat-containing protein [Actinokineospora spheciospongiae]|uniref:right-handed parallel beta-helix repeat-containing protein n=1 Tax=Actinokineospora spheciospongiae TaxID=909613 RepID=UPI000D946A60|nr:right-handed parallel beta-helix repeat-containing protein [Actinokineospora spheciospongiae]PWW63339.1 parallel beta helix pectate lyase-like protein [Actinokineospora spheciospongiae]
MLERACALALVAVVVLPGTGSATAAAGRVLAVGPGARYATPQAAADVVRPGDTVAIAAGTYPGGLTIRTDGTPRRPITFTGVGGPAVITGAGGPDGLLAVGNHSWQRFLNLAVSGSRGFGAHANGGHDLEFGGFTVDGSRDGGLVLVGTSRVSVHSCDIHGTNARGTSADHEALSIASGSRDVEVRHCRVHDNGEEGIDVKYTDHARVKIHDNVVTDNRGPNIYVDSATSVDVYNNVVSGAENSTKAGIALAVEDYSTTRRLAKVRVFNNVSTGNAQAGLSLWVESTGTMSDVQIVNNTFAGNRLGAVVIDADRFRGHNVLRNNIFAEGPVDTGPFVSDHNMTGDPGFADPAGGDFHLTAGSPAVDAGSPRLAPAFDLDGTPRPAGAGHDVGAYELGGTTTRPELGLRRPGCTGWS